MGHALASLADYPTLFMLVVVFVGLAILVGGLLVWDIAMGLARLSKRFFNARRIDCR